MSEFSTFCGISGFSIFVLYGFGQIFRHVVGSVYISEDEKFVRISHLTFFGNRTEKIAPLDNILHLTETNDNVQNTFLRLCDTTPSPPSNYFLTLKFGGILNDDYFSKVFGCL